MSDYSVTNEPDYERTYDEDETVEVRKGDLRAALDVATMSMDFASGFLDNEQVEALRKIATIIGIDPVLATPHNFVCQYGKGHQWQEYQWKNPLLDTRPHWECVVCRHVTFDDPAVSHVPSDPHTA